MATSSKASKSASKKKAQPTRVGSSKVIKSNGFKAWVAALVVLAVAVAGYAVVHFSEASSYSFIYRADKISGGTAVTKSSGVASRRLTLQGGTPVEVSVPASSAAMSASEAVCAQTYYNSDAQGTVRLYYTDLRTNSRTNYDFNAPNTDRLIPSSSINTTINFPSTSSVSYTSTGSLRFPPSNGGAGINGGFGTFKKGTNENFCVTVPAGLFGVSGSPIANSAQAGTLHLQFTGNGSVSVRDFFGFRHGQPSVQTQGF